MTAKEAMDIGMLIAEAHTAVALDILRVKPEATHAEMLRGCQVWLGSAIMKEICRLMPDEK